MQPGVKNAGGICAVCEWCLLTMCIRKQRKLSGTQKRKADKQELLQIILIFFFRGIQEADADDAASGVRADGASDDGHHDVGRVKLVLQNIDDELHGFRILTVAEAAALSGLDESFEFLGRLAAKQQQCGNGVPIALGRYCMQIIKKYFASQPDYVIA